MSEITAMMIDEAAIGSAVLERVSSDGSAVVPLDRAWSMSPEELRESAAASPFAFASRLLGVTPLLVERQPIRPIEGGRSFASTSVVTPPHTDSQMFLDAPAAVQILVCVTPAPKGGECILLDGARLLSRLEQEDPPLAAALFDVDRSQSFYFGTVDGPTVARRGGHLAWTVAPGRLGAADPVGAGLLTAMRKERPLVHALRAGEALVASNHRMLHGRRAFEGERELVRLLVWLEAPLAAEPRHVARAREVAPPLDPVIAGRLRAVMAILRGVPPAKAASEANVSESVLYGWRDAFARGGAAALR